MSKKSIFDLDPEQLKQILSVGKEAEGPVPDERPISSNAESQAAPTTSMNVFMEKPGDKIGRYKLLKVLGEGGMGMVYLAEQEGQIRRRVALKVIKPGMDSKRVIARFEAERQALALLDHPNIAQVYDAGSTESGRPYFVMEHVRGLPVTEYCDRHKLTIEDRLNLFVQICLAVHHAHQKGIIHRDIKPSNILVAAENDRPSPKVIDFGVAKAVSLPLTEQTLFTEDSQLLGTPEYMSPEQADMAAEDIDTRSDIYSLGVLLYVLLAGILPYDSATFRQGGIEHIRKMIRETDPKTPSTRLTRLGEDGRELAESRRTEVVALAKCLHRELEWIPLKAMRKERAERYRSASELADDIENYLKGAPLLAGSPSTVYRMRKFVARNRSLVSSAVAIAVILLLATIVSLSQMVSARRSEKIAKEAGRKETEQRQRAVAQELIARRRAYASDMNLAAQALSANNLGRARYLLNRHRPSASHPHLADSDDLRGWEWRYLWQQCRSDALYEFCQRTGSITSLSVSHDGRLLAIGEREGGGVSIWNLATREKLPPLFPHERHARVAFSPRETLLAFSTVPNIGPEVPSLPDFERSYIRLWDGKTEQIIRELPLAGSCFALEFSDDGRSLVSLHAPSRKEEGKITVWSIPEGKRLASFPANPTVIMVEPLAINPNKTFAVFVNRGRSIHLIDLVTGQKRWTATPNHVTTALALSKNGGILASGSAFVESAIRLWDVESGKEIGPIEGHRSWITDLHFPPDGKTLISASADQTIRVWDVSNPRNGKLLRTFRGHTTEVWRIALLPDNRTLVSGGKDGSVCVWDTQKRPFDIGPVIQTNVSSFRFTPDGSGVLTVDPNGCVTRLHGPRFQEEHVILDIKTASDYRSTLISPDNRFLAAPPKDGTIDVWDLQSGTVLHRITCQPSTEPIAFLAQGRKLVTFDRRDGGSHHMWDMTTGQRLQSWAGAADLDWRVSPAFTIDGRSMLTLRYYKVPGVLRDMTTGHQTHLDLDITETSGVSFSPNGELLASSSHLGFVKLWEVETFREVETLRGFLLGVHSVAFSPDGQRLAAGSDGSEAVKIWDVESLQELLTLPGEGEQHRRAAFSPDGDVLGTMSSGGKLHLWRAPSWEEIEAEEKRLESGQSP